MTVSPIAPRSMVELAPISTSSPIATAPELRHLDVAVLVRAHGRTRRRRSRRPGAAGSARRSARRAHSVTRATQRRAGADATRARAAPQPGPRKTPAPIAASGADVAAGADPGRRVDARARLDRRRVGCRPPANDGSGFRYCAMRAYVAYGLAATSALVVTSRRRSRRRARRPSRACRAGACGTSGWRGTRRRPAPASCSVATRSTSDVGVAVQLAAETYRQLAQASPA